VDNEEKLHRFNRLLLAKNAAFNLTAHNTESESWQKNISDSLLFSEEFMKLGKVRMLDIGSGGGMPAVPLAAVCPDLQITMTDSVNKKVVFLNEAIAELELSNACAVHTRIEEFAQKNREKYDIVTAKAVAPLPTLLEYALPFLNVGGYLYAFKGRNYQDEIDASRSALKILGGCVTRVESKKLDGDTVRYLLIIKKVGKTPAKYPRQKNLPRLQPLL
jgi:16S rRNA (guanine527-N7)-methyltransferase